MKSLSERNVFFSHLIALALSKLIRVTAVTGLHYYDTTFNNKKKTVVKYPVHHRRPWQSYTERRQKYSLYPTFLLEIEKLSLFQIAKLSKHILQRPTY